MDRHIAFKTQRINAENLSRAIENAGKSTSLSAVKGGLPLVVSFQLANASLVVPARTLMLIRGVPPKTGVLLPKVSLAVAAVLRLKPRVRLGVVVPPLGM